MSRATIMAVVNQKGGTGKTTTCENLGIGLANEGKRVLLVDTDPQASLTIALGHPRPDDIPVTLTDLMAKVMQDQPIAPKEGILSHEEGVDERDKKRAKQAIQHIGIYFNYIGKFENEVTQLTEPTEQEIRQMREKIEEAQKEKSRAYHRQYSREYRARNLEKQREYDRIKAREYRARRKAQAASQPAQ